MRVTFAVFLLAVLPLYAHASVLITEIMYAPEGADADHEWIEICNNGNESVSLDGWKFFEADVNHGLTLVSGSATLSTEQCAVVADDVDVFSVDYPSFSGTLFDSVFSLNNSGESVALKNSEGVSVDSVSYASEDGASNDGNSLVREGEGWVARSPTLGSHTFAPNDDGQTNTGSAQVSNGTPTQTTLYAYESVTIQPPEDVYVRVPTEVYTTVGAYASFVAELYDATGSVVTDARVSWSFGDGGSGEGSEVRHRFLHEGVYTTVVRAQKGTLRDTKDMRVVVRPLEASLFFDTEGAWVGLLNESERVLDVSGWRIHGGGQYFVIPEGTRILPGTLVRFPEDVTQLQYVHSRALVTLVYPDGTLALTARVYVPESAQTRKPEEVATTTIATTTVSSVIMVAPSRHVPLHSGVMHTGVVGMRAPTVSTDEQSVAQVQVTLVPSQDLEKSSTQQLASASVALEGSVRDTNSYWYLALGVLVLGAIVMVLLVRTSEDVVEGYTIVDVSEKK